MNPDKPPARGLTQPEIDTMTKPMSLADRLSGLNLRSRFNKGTRRRPTNRRWQAPAQLSLLEERCMLSKGDLGGIPVVTPQGGFVQPGQVMSQVNSTLTTIKITNNTDKTIYPFVEDSNVGKNPASTPGNGINPYYDYETTNAPGGDYSGQVYRLYAGYTEGGQTFFGVKPGATITMDIPLVFWNAGLFYIAGDTPSTTAYFHQEQHTIRI
jgi:hypothetical protein